MSKLKLTFACGAYELFRPLIEGLVAPEGVDLNILTMPSPERHARMTRHEEFDVCELSIGSYLLAWDIGRAMTAIPVFPHRRYRFRYIVKRMNCGIEKPSDLNGKRVGIYNFQNSAGLWMRGILQDHYGVDPKTIEWWCQHEEDIPVEAAERMRVRCVPKGKHVDEMLLNDELEAAHNTELLPSVRNGSPKVGPLFSNPKQAELDYYQKSRIFPIMHTVVIKNEIWMKDPWVAVNLLQAFQKSKEVCYDRMKNPRLLPLVWVEELMREQKAIFGPDPWPYNLKDNRGALETVARYAFEQGLIKKMPMIEDLFVPTSLQEIPRHE